MKIAISASERKLNSSIEMHFERASCYIIFILDDPGDAGCDIVPNPAAESINDMGILAAQMLINLGIDVLITGWCDPNTLRMFQKAKVAVIEASKGTVREMIAAIAKEKMNPAD